MTAFRWLPSVVWLLFASIVAAQSGPPPTPLPSGEVTSTGIIATSSEPGERLIVNGQVFAPDGVTPAPDVIVYAYQTDAAGLYHNDASGIARLHGWAKTDATGHFEFRTIRPSPYPNRSIPAHIHFHAWGGGYPLQWTEDLKFVGDPLLSPRDLADSEALGDFRNVRAVDRGPNGVWRCSIRFRLRKQTNYAAQSRDDPRMR